MKKSIISLLLIILLFYSISNISITPSQDLFKENIVPLTSNSFTKNSIISEPILIYNDGELVNHNFPGNGTFEDPFRIENLIIDAWQYGILISGVEHYFVIQNCQIYYAWLVGISIQNTFSGYGNITSNEVFGYDELSDGISLQNCQGITVKDNTLTDHSDGIKIKTSSNCSIVNNRCNNNKNAGIHVETDSSDCFIENNLIQNNDEYGLLFDQSGGSFVYNNTLQDNSLIINENSLEGYLNYELQGNIFNNRKIIYLKNLNNLVFNDTSCRNLFLINCSKIFISNLDIRDNLMGIFSYNSNNCTFQNNLFRYNTISGLKLINSNYTNIVSNTFSSNHRCFSLTNSYYILIKENSFNWQGIYLEEIDSTIIETITIENNTIDGSKLSYFYNENNLSLNESEYGQLIFYNCSDVTVSNQIMQHKENTISVIESKNFVIKNCIIDFSEGGVTLSNSQNITVKDCKLNSNNYGISVIECSMVSIGNITVLDNLNFGIEIRKSNETTISYCNVYSCGNGLSLESDTDVSFSNSKIVDCRYNNLFLNDISNCYLNYLDINNSDYGIYVASSNLFYIAYCSIQNAFYDGISIHDSDCINVMWSNISLNSYGIKSKSSSYGIYKSNAFFRNKFYGISFDTTSDHNVIYQNVFKDNRLVNETNLLSQAWDDGYNNTFYDVKTYVGNWWSNIKKSTYNIAGSSGSVDVFPLNPFIITQSNNHSDESSFSLIGGFFLLLLLAYSLKKKRENH